VPNDAAMYSGLVTFLASKRLLMSQRYMSAVTLNYLRGEASDARIYETQVAAGEEIFIDANNKCMPLHHSTPVVFWPNDLLCGPLSSVLDVSI
jgi:hypothetical protein